MQYQPRLASSRTASTAPPDRFEFSTRADSSGLAALAQVVICIMGKEKAPDRAFSTLEFSHIAAKIGLPLASLISFFQ
jgi:hypothetical protein